jgi:hypothetical protein
MIGWNRISQFRELSNYEELLNHAMEVNNHQTNSPQPFVVQKNPIE